MGHGGLLLAWGALQDGSDRRNVENRAGDVATHRTNMGLSRPALPATKGASQKLFLRGAVSETVRCGMTRPFGMIVADGLLRASGPGCVDVD